MPSLAVDPLADISRFRLPVAVAARLRSLLDRQDSGLILSSEERAAVEGLVDLTDLLTILRIRAEQGRLARPLVGASLSEEITEDEAILVSIRLGEVAADASHTFTHAEVMERSKSWTGNSSAQNLAEGDSTKLRDG
jgi:predicted transcriptional regulator